MPQTPLENVVTHWHKLIENFQISPKSAYISGELALDARRCPSAGFRSIRVEPAMGLRNRLRTAETR